MKQMRCILCLAVLACCMCFGCKPVYQQIIQGAWKIDAYYYDGSEDSNYTSFTHKDYRITFASGGSFSETYTAVVLPVGVTGTWEIDNKPNGKIGEFQLQLIDDVNGTRNYDIRKISRDTIDIYRTLSNGHSEELFLEPVPKS